MTVKPARTAGFTGDRTPVAPAFHPQDRSSSATAELGRMVMAVGSLLNWHAAVSIEHRPTEPKRSVVVRSWTRDGAPVSLRIPEWVEQLDGTSWQNRRVLWRPALGRSMQMQTAAIAVPIYVDNEIRGTLAFLGPSLGEPDAVALDFLEAIAGLMSHSYAEGRSGGSAQGAAHQGAGLVDVFAYTVRVASGGALQWRYFGPNSHEIFGEGIYPDEPLPVLLTKHAHPSDSDQVAAFMTALVEGRRWETDLRIQGVDGRTRWVSWRTDPRWTDGALFVDGVATDVSARHGMGRNCHEVACGGDGGRDQQQSRQEHAAAVREANDAVLQRLFAAGLRLQMLKRKLGDAEAHAVTAIAFQLDQAANDLREVIHGLDAVANDHS